MTVSKDTLIVALVKEVRKHWTHPENPCLCDTCELMSRFKREISEAEDAEMQNRRDTLQS